MKAVSSLLIAASAVQASVILARDDSVNAVDFGSIAAQPTPTATGPTLGASVQNNTVVATVASASGSAAATAVSNSKRDLVERNWCWWPWACSQPWPSSSTPWATTSAAKTTAWPTTSPPKTTSPPVTSSWVQPSTCTSTPYTPYYPATKTVTPSNTGTVSSSSSCPTQPEAGTYCGFLNPEDPCAPQPDGYGPVASPDTPEGFRNDPEWTKNALSAPVPSGFSQVFSNLNASVSAPNYLGLVTLQKYDVNQCASACECTDGCSAFNLFVERDPSQNPTNNDSTAPTVWGYNCPNPASMTSYKCTLWGGPINATDATNTGQTREQFQIEIAGSNGYNALPENPSCAPKPQPGWGNPHHCPGGGIDGGKHHMGGHFFPGPFDVRICAAFAVAQTSKNRDACSPGGTYDACNFWNAYALKQNGHFHGMYCALFTDKPDNADGVFGGSFEAGFEWEVDWSWSQYHDDSSWDHGVKN